jgi:hypothetical protein
MLATQLPTNSNNRGVQAVGVIAWRRLTTTMPWDLRCPTMWRSWNITAERKDRREFLTVKKMVYPSYPLAKIGVSGRLHDVCRRLSSRGLWAARRGKPEIIRRLELLPGRSGGKVPGP